MAVLFESKPVPCTVTNLLFTLIDRMRLLLTSYWTHWFKTLKNDNLSQHDSFRGGKLTQGAFLVYFNVI